VRRWLLMMPWRRKEKLRRTDRLAFALKPQVISLDVYFWAVHFYLAWRRFTLILAAFVIPLINNVEPRPRKAD
jgi:hypothetical protein